MIIEAHTLIEADKNALVKQGWKVIRAEGSAWILRCPGEKGWPPDPRWPKPMTCGWNKHNARSSPQACSNWPGCECTGPAHKQGRTYAAPKGEPRSIRGSLQ